MVLQDKDSKAILSFVKKEPRTIQDIARLLQKSWLTADSYVKQVKERTGLIDIKTFRAGSQGALKLVYYTTPDTLHTNDLREELYSKIKNSRFKGDFDVMELFQFIPGEKKRSFLEVYDQQEVSKNQDIVSLFRGAQRQIFCFSGNLSFINITENQLPLLELIEELLQRKVAFKMLSRINISSMNNLKKLTHLMEKYPGLMEMGHCYQPLRGFIIDDKVARFKSEEEFSAYKSGELPQNTRIFYEIYDPEWIAWLQKVFWNLFRYSIDYSGRLKELKNIG